MSNILSESKQNAILNSLTEGVSVRATERLLDVSRETVLSLLVRVGEGCEKVLDRTMRNLPCEQIEFDEIWGYVAKKQRHITAEDDEAVVGDIWTFVALDPVTKLVPCHRVGKRDSATARAFVADVAARMLNRMQISTDGLALYIDAVENAFGSNADYGQVVKSNEAEPIGPGRYSPPKVTSTEKTIITGSPDPAKICTSYIERQNLTMRMQIRRLTRLTNAFSKKLRNHRAAMALHFAAYNLVRLHGTLRTTPAMAAGVTNTMWSMDDLRLAALSELES